ncbi:MAG: FG-GAP repeat protein [Deltaproteobacteria bacterium]|nr:FG-GAP repeat protein [Deltaproteobacteria bacterium]
MRFPALVLCVAACGRLGFGGVDRDAGDDVGPRDVGDVGDAPDLVIDMQLVLRPTGGAPNDQFGYVVALSADGTTLAVGAFGRTNLTGAVYVYVKSGGVWSQQAVLTPANAGVQDAFGFSLAIAADGNTLVAGAPDEDSAATTIDGNGADNSASSAGAAYVFTRNGTQWTQQAYLKPSNSESGDSFGESVAISGSGDVVAVGASWEDGTGGPVPDPMTNGALESGAVYAFTRAGGVWTQHSYLKASNTGANDHFGFAVAVSGDGARIAATATGEASVATGIDGNEGDNTQPQSGAVYVFGRNGASWLKEAYVKASNSDGGDFFGYDVALSADGATLAVSAEGEDSPSMGVGGPQVEGAGQAGAVYLFQRGGGWTQTAYIKATNTEADDRFGRSVALSADGATLVVGAALEDSAQTGIGASGTSNAAADAGAAYVYKRIAGAWTPALYLKATDTASGDQFGAGTAVSGTGRLIAIGAFASDPAGADSGSIYTFE